MKDFHIQYITEPYKTPWQGFLALNIDQDQPRRF